MSTLEQEVRQWLDEWRAVLGVDETTTLTFRRVLAFLEANGCDGLREKLERELFGNPPKLPSILSELKTAEIVTRMGGRVRLLINQNPDLEVRWSDGNMLIEVTRKSSDAGCSRIDGQELQKVLEGLSLKITPQYPESLTEPGFSYEQREKRESRVRSVEKWLLEQIPLVTQSPLPCVLIEPMLDSSIVAPINFKR